MADGDVIELSGQARGEEERKPRLFAAGASAGTRFARSRVAMFALTVCTSGCLITEPIEFDDTKVPSHLFDPQPFSVSRVVRGATCLNGEPGQTFSFRISDANVNEQLVLRLIVNGRQQNAPSIPPTGQLERAPVTLCVRENLLRARCNRVEAIVSSAFKQNSADLHETEDENDYAWLEWWVLAPADIDPTATLEDCLAQADAGVE